MNTDRITEDTASMGVADPARLRECVHCGLCLNACPTYLELGTEMDSPRGRIHLIRALEEGSLPLDREVVRHLDLCLGCRACESACPSGVRYGSIIEGARAYVERHAERPRWERWRRRLVLSVFPYRRRVDALLSLATVARRMGVWGLLSRWVDAASMLPASAPAAALRSYYPAHGRERARVGLLTGCVAGALFADTNAAAVSVLQRNGVSVVVPPGQGCCGALHLHSGAPAEARDMARRNVDAFPDELDAVVVTAAGCGSTLKEYATLLAGESRYGARAARLAGRVRDVTELLAALPIEWPAGGAPMRVTYHDACHLAHAQGVRSAPRQLLAGIPGVELIELAESDVCCGSAGSYNLTEPEMAHRLRERKVDRVAATGAQVLATANPGCALQIRAGLLARGLEVRVAHPVELLAEAYARGAGSE